MGLVDHCQSFVVAYSPSDTFKALVDSMPGIKGLTINMIQEDLMTIDAKMGVSMRSWGEIVKVQVVSNPNGAMVNVLSTPKTGIMFGGAMDMGKNQQNIDQIRLLVIKELEKYEKFIPDKSTSTQRTINVNELSMIEKIKQYAELKDLGIITESEFEEKKKQILNLQ